VKRMARRDWNVVRLQRGRADGQPSMKGVDPKASLHSSTRIAGRSWRDAVYDKGVMGYRNTQGDAASGEPTANGGCFATVLWGRSPSRRM
jgi:hypothetical protein